MKITSFLEFKDACTLFYLNIFFKPHKQQKNPQAFFACSVGEFTLGKALLLKLLERPDLVQAGTSPSSKAETLAVILFHGLLPDAESCLLY